MNTTYGWSFVIPCTVMAGTSIGYFLSDRSGSSVTRRIVTSAHGLVGAVLFVVAMVLVLLSNEAQPELARVFLLLYLIPVGLLVVSSYMYRGPSWLHRLQIINMPALLWAVCATFIELTHWAI